VHRRSARTDHADTLGRNLRRVRISRAQLIDEAQRAWVERALRLLAFTRET
jgi:hypothetical protein